MRDLKKSSNSLETRRIRKILNEEARLGISPNSESETEEVDLQKELYPLGHYINNREEMIEQMFSIIKGAKLKKMLPPILKDMPFDELRADCLIHLLGMSKKRIKAILDGKEINSSSDSESHSDTSTTPSKKQKVDVKPFVIKQEGCSDISDNSEEVVLVDPDLDFLNVAYNDVDTTEEKKMAKRKLKRKELDKKHKRSRLKMVEQAPDTDEVQHIDSSAESASENETEIQAPAEGKTLLEILELEMRARAIRALLKNDTQEGEVLQKGVEGSSSNPESSKEKLNKQTKEGITEKVTPAKNFRKKKLKSDDVIVVAPKVVTIDLTDENEQFGLKSNKDDDKEENVPLTSQSKKLGRNCQEVVVNSSETNNEICKSSVSGRTTVTDKEVSKAKAHDVFKVGGSCSIEKSSESDSLDKTNQSEHGKSSWAQRWLESKEVKKVVSTSKICGNIRKKIKFAKLANKQKQNQEELVKPSPAPQQEMEGSVVEYELLLKPKMAGIDVGEVADNNTQASLSSANQEPTSSKADLIETPSADQVQDVSSTKAENPSNDTVQDIVSSFQISEEKTTSTNMETDKSDNSGIANDQFHFQNELLSTNINKEADGHYISDINVERKEAKCLNKIDDNHVKNEHVYSTIKTGPNKTTTNHENENPVEIKEFEQENDECHQDKIFQMESNESKSNDSDECNGSLAYKGNDTQNCESDLLLTEVVINSKTVDENEFGCNSKINIEPNPDHKRILHTETKTLENNISVDDTLEIFETSKTVVPESSTKPTQEQNEPETLEINITDEDRDFEDVLEENKKRIN